jgi:protein-glutamine gamma-glutamyltransferase
LPMEKRWDAANFSWQRWVLNYNTEKQKNVLEHWLGGSDWQTVIKGLGGLCILFAIAFSLWLFSLRKMPKLSAEALLVRPLFLKLFKLGFTPNPEESVMVFLDRVGEQRGEYKIPARYIAKLFEQVIYAGNNEARNKLQRAVKQFPNVVRN